jgi:hypothetical protein
LPDVLFLSSKTDSTIAQDIGCKSFVQYAYKNITGCTVFVQISAMPGQTALYLRDGLLTMSHPGGGPNVAHDLLNALWLRPFPAGSAPQGSGYIADVRSK